jgi:hypothetical protein
MAMVNNQNVENRLKKQKLGKTNDPKNNQSLPKKKNKQQ